MALKGGSKQIPIEILDSLSQDIYGLDYIKLGRYEQRVIETMAIDSKEDLRKHELETCGVRQAIKELKER